MNKYLITGTGRCGTGYTSKVLSSTGNKCTHEQVFTRQGWDYALEQLQLRAKYPEWGWVGESSWLATPFLDKEELQGMTIVHLVRHPKNMIDSNLRLQLYTHPQYGPYFNWMRQYIPEIDEYKTPEEKGAYWYIKLNQMTEPYATVFHRVEDDVKLLLDKLEIDYKGKQLYDNKKYNSRKGNGPSDINLNKLPKSLKDELYDMTIRYGYDWDEAPTDKKWYQKLFRR